MRKLLTLLLLFSLLACQSDSLRTTQIPQKVELITAGGDVISASLAFSPSVQEQGLSGVRAEDFDTDDGMLFYYLQEDEKHFWMPDTYFDLDLIYLDKNFKVVDIIRKLPHYKGRANPELIPRARGVWARHVLEMKAASEISQKIKLGDKLQLKSDLSLEKLDERIRQQISSGT
jgi:uncharacterized membrane protein (UPF0127 family)